MVSVDVELEVQLFEIATAQEQVTNDRTVDRDCRFDPELSQVTMVLNGQNKSLRALHYVAEETCFQNPQAHTCDDQVDYV